MDTIKNAIYGTQKTTEEPVSGQQGAGTVNDAYDQGNERTTDTTSHTTPHTTSDTTSHTTSGTPSGSTAGVGGAPTSGGSTTVKPTEVENKAPQSGVDTTKRDGPSEAVHGDAVGDPKSGQAPADKHQGAAKPQEEPSKDSKPKVPHTDEEREEAMLSGNFPHDPNDHSGEPLKMHGGAKGQTAEETPKDDLSSGKKDRSASVQHEGGAPHGKKQGTGEQVVKASGLAADGGDFDATKPGAGSEATRLMEEKGIKSHPSKPTADPTTESHASGTADTEKVSKVEKIKEKLHMAKK